ncbi:ABC-2 transporter permease [uncultured Robinsoniella sp.]|uniref:ABC-2 transporter permease n=1 Tax=uncultured Robinsoniella sp. TaxID=904190 RepID=UPI00374E8CFC
MRGLILKDLYNIGHNAKMMVMMLVAMAVLLVPTNGVISFMGICVIACSMMLITTISFDDLSKWNRYALIMPVSRRDVVKSKYMVLIIFSLVGCGVGIVICSIGSIILKDFNLADILGASLGCLGIAFVFGSIILPLLYKFGAEKARMLMIVCFLIPTAVVYFVAYFYKNTGLPMPGETSITIAIVSLPVLCILFMYISYRISLKIFQNQEL